MKLTKEAVRAILYMYVNSTHDLTDEDLIALYEEFVSSTYNRAELALEVCLQMFMNWKEI